MSDYPTPPAEVVYALREGQVIPAHPLALDSQGRFDERYQRALTRYYHAAGAGGVAVGVHTTQFEIRDPTYNLFEPVLDLAAETVAACDAATGRRTVRVAGICGETQQAVREASYASGRGYHAGLISLAALPHEDNAGLIRHCDAVAREIPLFGFYLQPAVGGRHLSVDFWRRFAEIPNVIAVKVAPFDRYLTVDVIRAVAEVGRSGSIALYTGNDDHILLDLLTAYEVDVDGRTVRLEMAGGLLGHWAFWTRRAVEQLAACRQARREGVVPDRLLTLAGQVTEANSAVFDVAHQFAGCIPGIHTVLHRQGLLRSPRCLSDGQVLSPGQQEEIDRVCRVYPHLNDDSFVEANRDEWLA
jgi:dihydrodipicolinate synthase/N-acetylneuraminate lyase